MRNHAHSALIQEGNLQYTICSDDVMTWDSFGLSFDFYELFMGIAGSNMDLRLLKQLVNFQLRDIKAFLLGTFGFQVFNSMKYSSMDADEKNRCTALLQSKWDAYMETFVDPDRIQGD